ncbi:acetylcholine receptor subunit alpha-like [Plakobranchus ocellatus]|uniref:Acetylcholine receptor subunit alpha-like n=1 Tax=Plakobranchus ocellatus TaxID=259542 RepID=A0AAV3ZSP4_9GAST|nr:acetylcholine receptor subunit alpha-like [Plakobranchus ocellatus]
MRISHLLPHNVISKLPTVCALLLISPCPCGGSTYSEKKSIYDALLNSSRYNSEMRPLLNQSDVMYVYSVFELVSIVEINDVVQSFHCNGFLGLRWYDELITWDPAEYGGEIVINPKVQDVFRPRMVMLNTLEDRDLFEDDYAPLSVYADGLTTWAPGSIFIASCKLDLTKYPFDEQTCSIEAQHREYAQQFAGTHHDSIKAGRNKLESQVLVSENDLRQFQYANPVLKLAIRTSLEKNWIGFRMLNYDAYLQHSEVTQSRS